MKSEKLDRRPVILAAITASVLVLIFGLTYRVLATIMDTPVTTVPIASDVLEGLPLQIGDWTGVDVPLDESIVLRTDSDALINRRYSRGDGFGSISLYICCGVNTSELMVHRPQVCYPANGWTLANRSSAELTLEDEKKLPYSIYKFYRGNMNREEVTVLHYIITEGQYHDSISVSQRRLWKLFSAVPWVAQVQIAASSGGIKTNDAMIKKIISDFAVDSALPIAELFQNIQNDRITETTDPVKKESSRQ